MLHKNFEIIETKAEGDSGEFTAIVSTFGNVDRVGDRILPGAWTKTLAQWVKSGDPIPIILAHQWNDPFAHVGYARPEDVKQVAKGLQVTGKLDVEDNPVAKQVHKLMKRRSLKEFSIGYDVPAGGESRAKDGANEISELNLAECGPCLKGIDPKTELHDVKAALGVQEAPDAKALAEEAARVAREIEQQGIPALPAVKQLASDVREQLDAAGGERFGRSQERWAYLDDYDPDAKWAVFHVSSAGDRRYVRVDYTLSADGVVLGADEAEVVRTTSYRDVNGSKTYGNSELQEVKEQLAEVLEAVKKKADVTDKEPTKARSVDPLRKQADAVALEIASDGQSLRKPPKEVEQTRPEPSLSLRELKQRTRDELVSVLSGGSTE